MFASIAPKVVNERDLLSFSATATDSSPGVTLSYSLAPGAPAGAAINPSTGAFTWTPTAPGKYTVTVRATDNSSPPLGDAKTFTITVKDVAPVVTLASAAPVAQGDTVVARGSFSSLTPGLFIAAVDYGDGTGLQLLGLSPSRTFTLSHAYARPGTFTITVGVMDSFGTVGRQTLSVTVTSKPLVSGFGAGRDAFVTTLYVEDLNRLPEPSGLQFWSRVLASGVSPKNVALAIWGSTERRALVNQHLAPSITFQRSYADALLAGRLAARPSLHPTGPLALSFPGRAF